MEISSKNALLLGSFCLTFFLSVCNAQLLEGIYCGRENCYDVLNVTRDSTGSEVRRMYRRLAKKTHPDLFRDEEQKKEAEEKFKLLANAYEILRDDEARKDYDYMLDNPSEYYSHYYRYYRRRMAPKVDVRLVLIVTISVISIIQYYSLWQRYDSAIKYFMTVPKYRIKAMEIAAEQQRQEEVNGVKNGKPKSRNRVSKAELKEEQERKIRQIIEEKMDIKGAYAKPKISDVLWVQLIILPYTLTKYVYWYSSWIWRFTIMRQPYGDDEKFYLIRKYMKVGQWQFDGLDDHEKQSYLDMELWIKENFDEWKAEQEEEMKAKLAESARHKSYRRYMKNHGPGRMTFED
ncbi:dnaJ homolog subfamily C member 25 homolog [Sitodiplosis mosellana]|uniref:dnaJ homolog subfamily C member 25 homolog n=1 Tax=Sitodiplosis mosellana TaxID=263140 RepID=UPI0024443DC6|nr:dnaJ homolog subfamily C member 25 homolog [Sitodiplosis mosellana]